MTTNKQWVTIKGFENYEISNTGNVRNVTTKKVLNLHDQGTGYLQLHFCVNGKQKTKLIHQIVAESFIPNPNGYTEIDHIDRNPYNNSVSNLRWCNHSANMRNSAVCPKIRLVCMIEKLGNEQNPLYGKYLECDSIIECFENCVKVDPDNVFNFNYNTFRASLMYGRTMRNGFKLEYTN